MLNKALDKNYLEIRFKDVVKLSEEEVCVNDCNREDN